MGPERTPLLQSTMEDDILGDLDLDQYVAESLVSKTSFASES